MAYGYGTVSAEGFVGVETALEAGPWGEIDTRKFESADGTAKGLRTAPTEVFWKIRLRGAIRTLVRALGGENEAIEADAVWDRLQRRLDAELALQATDEDAAVSSAAKRLRARFLHGEGTGQTLFSYANEVAVGRTQARVSKEESVAADVKLCSLGPTLKKIVEATEALALAADTDGTGGKSQSVRVRQARNGCVQAFNGVHEALDAAIALTAPGPELLALEALRAPLQILLEAHRDEAKPAKPEASPEGPKLLP